MVFAMPSIPQSAALPLLVLASLGTASAQRPQPTPTPNDTLVSPEIHSDRRVTFRIYAPKSVEVTLRGDWMEGPGAAKLAKGDQGVWSATVGPLAPDVYRYSFSVDGVKVVDPRNPGITEGRVNADSIFELAGEGAEFLEVKPTPHGVTEIVWYQSTSLGKMRRMHVYTPPGYATSRDRYPVLYLVHGGGDNDTGWYAIGRANLILDNLIAQGRARPMIIVMPNGHAVERRDTVPVAAGQAENTRRFSDDLLNDIIPYIEKNYRVLATAEARAMAGLSMGGSLTLNVGFPNLDTFRYLGVFSSGLRTEAQAEFEKRHHHLLNSPDTRKKLKLFWIACGEKDPLAYAGARNLVQLLNSHGIDHVFKESAGGHTWLNWRRYLHEFAPLLFQ